MRIKTSLSPGDNIRELMKAQGWTQEDLAEIMGVSLKTVNKLIQNKQSITLETANLLSSAFPETKPFKWMMLNTRYEMESFHKSEGSSEETSVKAHIYKYVPVAELYKRGWLKKTNDIENLRHQVQEFLGIDLSDNNALGEFYKRAEDSFAANFRKSEVHQQFNFYAAETWCRMVEIAANHFKTVPYRKSTLEALYNRINTYTILEDGVEQFLRDLNETGVKFLVLPHLQKTYIDGAALLVDKVPVIAYTARYKRLDNFWFTMAHEIAHVLYHLNGKRNKLVDDINGGEKKDPMEVEADSYAQTHLKLKEISNYFQNSLNYVTVEKVNACSEELQIHRSIVIGSLAFEKTISYKHLHLFNEDILTKIPKKYMVESFING